MFSKILKGTIIGAAPFAGYAFGIKKAEQHYEEHTELVRSSKEEDIVGIYSFPPSFYCSKVSAFLDYHGTPYKNVTVDYFTKEQIYFSSDYKKVPIAIIKGNQVNESADIVKALAVASGGRFSGGYSKSDAKAMEIIDSQVVPAITMNMFASFESINNVASQYGLAEKIVFPVMSPVITYTYRQQHGDAADASNLEASLRSAFNVIGTNKRATASELALFGALKGVYCLDAVQLAVANCGRTPWFESIKNQCEANSKQITA